MGIGEGTTIHSRTTIRGPAIIGEHCEIGPRNYIIPHTSIDDNSTIQNTEIENSIIMEGAHTDCGHCITDSLIDRKAQTLNNDNRLPRGHKLILGDKAMVTLQ